MRFEAKNPGVVELMRIQTEDLVLPEIRGVQSELRILKQAIRIRFRDVEEENSVLKSGDFTEEMKLKLPSLYRLNELPEESFQSVVAQLTVSEIARCWVGPDWLLNSIEARLPERKKVLLKDLQQKVSPNRDHPAFSKLLELCDEVWSSPGEVKKAA
jgi:hypothetical protein